MKTNSEYIRNSGLWFVSICWVFVCFSSCLNERLDCPDGLYLIFSPVNPKHNLMNLLEEVDIYLYDPDGSLVNEYHYKNTALRASDYGALITDIPFGSYKAVVIINQTDCFETFGEKSYPSLHTDLARPPESRPLSNLFTGEIYFSYGLDDMHRPAIPVPVFKHANHITVNLRISGSTTLPDNPEVRIEGRNGSFHYQTYSPYTDLVIVYPANQYEKRGNDYYYFMITTLRMWIGGDIKLFIDTPDKNIELNLPAELAKIKNSAGVYLYDTNEKLEFEDEYKMDILLDKELTIIGLSINGWHIIYGGTEV